MIYHKAAARREGARPAAGIEAIRHRSNLALSYQDYVSYDETRSAATRSPATG